MAKDTEKVVNLDGWTPVPGFVLCRPVKREELQGGNTAGLSLPDKVGKASDSVGVGEVILVGPPKNDKLRLGLLELQAKGTISRDEMEKEFLLATSQVGPGDLIGWMPYTDSIIEVNLKKYTVVPYDKIRVVKKVEK